MSNRIVFGVCLLFAGGWAVSGCGRSSPSGGPGTNPGFDLSVKEWINTPSIGGGDLKGKVVVVEFWATWCSPCLTSIPRIDALYRKHRERGLVVIGVTAEEGSVVKPFISKMKMSYPVALDAEGKSNAAYSIQSIPHAFLYDRDGRRVWDGHPMGGLEEAVERLFD